MLSFYLLLLIRVLSFIKDQVLLRLVDIKLSIWLFKLLVVIIADQIVQSHDSWIILLRSVPILLLQSLFVVLIFG